MAFKMKGFSGFQQRDSKIDTSDKDNKKGYDTNNFEEEEEKKRIAENQDPGSGRNKLEEMRYDMQHTQEEIKRFKVLAKDNPQKYNRAVGMLSSALEKQKKAYLKLITELGMVPK
jgi:hypothetical protein